MTSPGVSGAPDTPHGDSHPMAEHDSEPAHPRPTPGESAGTAPRETPAAAGGEAATPGENFDEEALRALMREAVQGLEPGPDALDRLRRAIPARRQHRRQALAGAAAAVLLGGMAVPALIRVADTATSAGANPANVASSHAATPDEDGYTSTLPGTVVPSGRPSAGPSIDQQHGQHPTADSTFEPTTLPAGPSGTATAAAPDCSRTQLGDPASATDAPDSDGRVYGWFRITNVSGTPCTVSSGGQVRAVAEGAADPSRIQVVDHTSGDPATGLPPATAQEPILLHPGENYEVAFAWVPASDGPGGCTSPSPPTDSPEPTPTATASGDSGAAPTSSAAAPQTGEQAPRSVGADASDPSSPARVALDHTPAAGAPVVSGPVIQDACAGTVYTTPAMASASTETTTPAP